MAEPGDSISMPSAHQAKSQRDGADETSPRRIPETYQWLLVPEQADPLAKVALRPVKVFGSDPLAVRAGAKLRNEEHLITKRRREPPACARWRAQ